MNNYKFLLLFLVIGIVTVTACSKMDENYKKYAGETVYPGKFDTIVGRVGYERLEIDLMKAGRIRASDIKLGKAVKTVVEYDGKTVTIDTLASWLNITNLTEPKLYRIKAYTMDDAGNKSVPQEIALIPFSKGDKANLTVPPPKVIATPDAVALSWPSGLSSVLLDYYGLKYSYKDKNGVTREGMAQNNPVIVMQNVKKGELNTINISFKIIPKVNGIPIIDTVWLDQEISVQVPQSVTPYFGIEQTLGAKISVSRDNDGGPASREGSLKLIDFDYKTKLYMGSYTPQFWMQQELFAPAAVNSYMLSTGDDAPDRDPKSWTLSGSNNAVDWTTVDTRTGEMFSQRSTYRIFDFTNTTPYKYYRLAVTQNNGAGSFQLGEWRLFTK